MYNRFLGNVHLTRKEEERIIKIPGQGWTKASVWSWAGNVGKHGTTQSGDTDTALLCCSRQLWGDIVKANMSTYSLLHSCTFAVVDRTICKGATGLPDCLPFACTAVIKANSACI